MTYEPDLSADIIDLRDIIARVEELEAELEAEHDARETTLSFEYALQDRANFPKLDAEYIEWQELRIILSELAGYGGDEQFEGNWYPVTLIADSYFIEYARELVIDCGDLPREIPSYIEIDWDATARNIQADYSSITINGSDYWYR